MAGRGRGRGRTINFTGDQFLPKEVQPPSLQPPPAYPILEHKPLLTATTNEYKYLLQLKNDFADFIRDSPNFVVPLEIKKEIERFSDRYQDLLTNKQRYDARYDWTRLPEELKPSRKKKKACKSNGIANKVTKHKDIDVVSKLTELESKEIVDDNEEEEGNEEGGDEDKDDDEANEEEEDADEEMDEGTDYVNNYFDNGEDYEEEDDNLEDGAIY